MVKSEFIEVEKEILRNLANRICLATGILNTSIRQVAEHTDGKTTLSCVECLADLDSVSNELFYEADKDEPTK